MATTEMCITVASHHFVVTRINPRVRPAINEFAKTLIQYGLMKGRDKRFHQKAVKVYAASTSARDEYRFHINHFNDFKKVLEKHYIHDGMVEWRKKELFEAAPLCLKVRPHLTPREHQVAAIDYIVKEEGSVSRLIELQTGQGKTLVSMFGADEIGKRIAVILKPSYVDQWLRDFKQNTELDPSKIVTVIGSAQLKSVLNMAANGSLPYDVIIISNATYRNYIAEYELYGKHILKMGYACLPENLFEHLKVGFRVIDEVHQDFHLNFKCDLYTNVTRSLSLSATFKSDDHFVNKMYEVYSPRNTRYIGGSYVKYVNAYSLQYQFGKPSFIRTLGKTGMYSHHEFENSIMKSPQMLENYFKMIHSSMMFTYDYNYRVGNRCLIYFASIEMCTRFTDWITERYPPSFKIARYVEDDSYDDMLKADIIISTLGSAGTGIDIPDLTTVILTTNVNSTQGNLQGFGRIRQLKDGRKMYFVYLVCTDFPKHIEYHDRKVELLRTRALAYEERFYNSLI